MKHPFPVPKVTQIPQSNVSHLIPWRYVSTYRMTMIGPLMISLEVRYICCTITCMKCVLNVCFVWWNRVCTLRKIVEFFVNDLALCVWNKTYTAQKLLFDQSFKVSCCWCFVRGITSGVPSRRTSNPGKYIHVMTSSWIWIMSAFVQRTCFEINSGFQTLMSGALQLFRIPFTNGDNSSKA